MDDYVMDDYIASPIRVSEYKHLSWIFKCISWQHDRILDLCEFTPGSWDSVYGCCNASDPNGLPPDIIVIQFRYQNGDRHILPINFWMKKDAIIGSNVNNNYQMSCVNFKLDRVFEKMLPECTLLIPDLVREVIDVAQTLASMPRNIGRDCLSFVYQVSVLSGSFQVENDSPRVKFVGKFVCDEANSETKVCTVCLDDISQGDEVILMPCSHIYHGGCILRWLEIKSTCPVCLLALPIDS